MDFLSESLKGRLLFAIPKKGAATGIRATTQEGHDHGEAD